MELVDEVYRLTSGFPKDELFGLNSQMRRAAVSIPANIAEGAARNGSKEFAHFLGVAVGSMAELDTLLEIAERQGLTPDAGPVRTRMDKAQSLLLGLRESIRRKLAT